MAHYRTVLQVIGVIVLCFFGIPIRIEKSEPDVETVFRAFVEKYNRSYKDNDTEYANRLAIFKHSMQETDKLNSKRVGDHSALYGITQYSDLTKEEYEKKHLLLSGARNGFTKTRDPNNNIVLRRRNIQFRNKRYTLPERIDWRDYGIISKVRDQGACGACWAHSIIATVESMIALKTGKLSELSVQQMVDCSLTNKGCGGGDTCSLLDWLVEEQNPILSKLDYERTKLCTGKGAYVTQYSCSNLSKNEYEILMILALHGPLVVGVNALSWQNYLGGVIQFHCDGGLNMLNHAVQVVGYDLTGPVPYYILRNSWGIGFGNNGYLFVAIGNNVCGIAEEVATIDGLKL